MPFRKVPESSASYFLIAVDESGAERSGDPDAPGGLISDLAIHTVAEEKTTDVFVWCHGWKGDVKESFSQFDRWIGAFAAQEPDRAEMVRRHPDFKDMHIGFHWPSLAWSDESLVRGDSFSAAAVGGIQTIVNLHASELGDSPAVRSALQQLFEELRTNTAATELSDNARSAYLSLDAALGLGEGAAAGDGGADRERFDPDMAMPVGIEQASYGGTGIGSTLLEPLRMLTFWTMKKRAKTVGQNGLYSFLKRLQQTPPEVRIHLMGHSFGCIVTSAAMVGPEGGAALPSPIASCVLVQGATSLWAFGPSNPYQEKVAGYFNAVIDQRRVSGPLVTTQSRYDHAVGKLYPWAVGLVNQTAYQLNELPKFGAIGKYGICGVEQAIAEAMRPQDAAYAFVNGGVYNVDGSAYICKVEGLSGAHSDIAGPEVAHLIWQAAMPVSEVK